MSKWDRRFLELARHVGQWSRDPSTKTGCVIAACDKRVLAVGFNGFPMGVGDLEERYAVREVKYKMVVHAEVNAVVLSRQDVRGATCYTWPWPPCSQCAGVLIQAGVIRAVAPTPTEEQRARGWAFDVSATMFSEAGVVLQLVGEA